MSFPVARDKCVCSYGMQPWEGDLPIGGREIEKGNVPRPALSAALLPGSMITSLVQNSGLSTEVYGSLSYCLGVDQQ